MVMHEREKPRDTYLLVRGQYDQPDKSEKLNPAIPSVLGQWQEHWPRNRLGLAKWLMDSENPLTSRVTVNRIWQHYFGIGLVKTSENFGLQGQMPSHPGLLDWLALEFIRTGWDVKKMHRLIVTSATYRQASNGTVDLQLRDPENRLIGRGPRKRLSPYAIRDTALFASGLLVEKIGGPSVKPYMPPGIWSSISNARYKQDKGEKLYRRSMYTYWRRTLPPPTMMTFNAAAREICIVRTDKTITPLQALTMMNNVTFVEAARFLAERVLKLAGLSNEERIQRVFRMVIGRVADSSEIKQLLEDLEFYRQDFMKRPGQASKLLAVGEKKPDATLLPVDLASFTMVANTILNLDEAMTQD